MVYSCIEFFKNNCGANNYILGDIRWLNNLVNVILPILVVASILVSITFKSIFLFYICLVLTIVIFYILLHIFNYKLKKIVCKKYKFNKYRGWWHSKEVLNIFRETNQAKLYEYLYNQGFNTIDKYIILRDKLKDELKDRKPQSIIVPSIFGALLVSLFNNTISWMFSKAQIFDEGVKVLLMGIFLIILISSMYFLYKCVYIYFVEIFFSEEYHLMKRLYSTIEDIIMNFDSLANYNRIVNS